MITFCQRELERYKKNDWILRLLDEKSNQEEEKIRTNEWMRTMDNKRFIYSIVYGDFLLKKSKKRILDIGGGYNSLTKVLAENCDYTLLDFMAHGGDEYIKEHYRRHNINWINSDWYEAGIDGKYDVIIANDIFPDVDQRLELFIDRMLPICRELRLVLTYYNHPQFYTTKRVDDSEVMTFLSWDGLITSLKLMNYKERMENTTEKELLEMRDDKASIFRNGRQVSYIVLKGDCE